MTARSSAVAASVFLIVASGWSNAATQGEGASPPSRSSLFEIDAPKDDAAESGVKLNGFGEFELAYTTPSPAHFSRILTRAQFEATGEFSAAVKWKLSGRVDYDAVYHLTDFYPPAVAHDARLNFFARENYIDVSAEDWDFRFGRQQIVWGEMIALFVADVVSAKDLREFILPDFHIVRIPQWAARAEYFKNDFHAEFVWIPAASYNKIGVPGAQFYAAPPEPPPGFAEVIETEQFPKSSLSHTNYGMRLSVLRDGWDVAGYYYGSMDQSPTFYRTIVANPEPTFVYQPSHERINQGGFTVTKDFAVTVLKAEAAFTQGRKYNVDDLSVPNGVIAQNTLDWAASLEFNVPILTESRLNLQAFQRIYVNHDDRLSAKKYENGYSIYASTQLPRGWEATLLWGSSLNRTDWMLRLGLARNFDQNWRFVCGVDLFDGSSQGIFGQFKKSDRVYTQVFYSF